MTLPPDLHELLAEVEKLDKAATPGPWQTCEAGKTTVHVSVSGSVCKSVAEMEQADCDERDGNAEFISRSRTLLPQLAAAVRALAGLMLEHFENHDVENGQSCIYCDDDAYYHVDHLYHHSENCPVPTLAKVVRG